VVAQARRRSATSYGARRRSAAGRLGVARRREAAAFTCGAMATCGRDGVMVMAMYEWRAERALATGDGQGTIRGRAHAHTTRADASDVTSGAQPGVRRAWARGRGAQNSQTTCKR
jgi:hypothetical protein